MSACFLAAFLYTCAPKGKILTEADGRWIEQPRAEEKRRESCARPA